MTVFVGPLRDGGGMAVNRDGTHTGVCLCLHVYLLVCVCLRVCDDCVCSHPTHENRSRRQGNRIVRGLRTGPENKHFTASVASAAVYRKTRALVHGISHCFGSFSPHMLFIPPLSGFLPLP